ncbi:hypothetical protein MKW98_026787 [Papaver atlanticum]|uniref:Uncharacterized protein n=1 Tax=Papaver atlanticum TaxID=357466 RepID=A0AAD4X5G7_9MAGN|nr:hypothetical protein MKW98_026787 [Papaver atlanticum]
MGKQLSIDIADSLMCFRVLLSFMILGQITLEDISGYIKGYQCYSSKLDWNKLRPVILRRIERGLKTTQSRV